MTMLQLTPVSGLIGVVAKGTRLLALGWCETFLLRRAPAGARHVVWLTVIIGVLLIPGLARIAPMNVPVLPSVAAAPPRATARRSGPVVRGGGAPPGAAPAPPAAIESAPTSGALPSPLLEPATPTS